MGKFGKSGNMLEKNAVPYGRNDGWAPHVEKMSKITTGALVFHVDCIGTGCPKIAQLRAAVFRTQPTKPFPSNVLS